MTQMNISYTVQARAALLAERGAIQDGVSLITATIPGTFPNIGDWYQDKRCSRFIFLVVARTFVTGADGVTGLDLMLDFLPGQDGHGKRSIALVAPFPAPG